MVISCTQHIFWHICNILLGRVEIIVYVCGDKKMATRKSFTIIRNMQKTVETRNHFKKRGGIEKPNE